MIIPIRPPIKLKKKESVFLKKNIKTKKTNKINNIQFISIKTTKNIYHCQLLILTFYDNDTIYIDMKKDTSSYPHIIDDICDCMIEAFGRVSLDPKELTIENLRCAIEEQLRSQPSLAPRFREMIEIEDERITKH
jgi:hypothetical protein